MPTLRVTHVVQEFKPLSLTGNLGETATTADFALFDGLATSVEPLSGGGGTHENGRRGDHDRFANNDMNDSTLSGSLLEEALDMLRASKETQRQASSSAAANQQKEGSGCPSVPSQIVCGRETTTEGGPPAEDQRPDTAEKAKISLPLSESQEFSPMETADESSVENDDEYSCHSFDLSPPRTACLQQSSKVGPKELLHREKYASFVAQRIQSESHVLQGYRAMSNAQKEREQERVLALLHRLGIRPLDGEPSNDQQETDGISSNDVGAIEIERKARLHPTSVPGEGGSQQASERLQSVDPEVERSVEYQTQSKASRKSVSFALDIDEPLFPDVDSNSPSTPSSSRGDSMAVPAEGTARHRTQPPLHQDSSVEGDDDTLVSLDDEAEVARSKQMDVLEHGSCEYDSPTATSRRAEMLRKRSATSSGKRGADTSRTRPSDVPLSYGLPLAESDQSRPFILSASPISPYHRHDRKGCSESPHLYMEGEQDISLGDSSSDDSVVRSKTATTTEEESILFTSTSFDVDDSTSRPLRDASNQADVRARQGASFRLQPLETRPSRKECFPDPFCVYDGDMLLPRMLRVVGKLCRREASAAQKPGSIARAIILSMEMPHIHRLVLKLVLETSIAAESSPRPFGQATTLIVAREREELEAWNRIFRESSSLRVLNHSTLPVVQRKTRSSAELCSSYDVVLTTYDCLKSADVTVQIDYNGYAQKTDAFGNSGEWVTSRTTSSQVNGVDCKQLSVLHCLCWRRIVYLDTVGRKSFLSKPDTARSSASKALNSNSRIMFFTCSKPDIDSMEALSFLVKSDRRAIESVAAILRAIIDGSESDFLRHVVIDLNRRTTKNRRPHPNV